MGLFEMLVVLSVILTIGHYIVKWAAYLEKKFELVSRNFLNYSPIPPCYHSMTYQPFYRIKDDGLPNFQPLYLTNITG